MPKLTETFASKLSHPESGTRKYWDTEVKGFGLFAGKQSKTWYFQRDVGGQTRRICGPVRMLGPLYTCRRNSMWCARACSENMFRLNDLISRDFSLVARKGR